MTIADFLLCYLRICCRSKKSHTTLAYALLMSYSSQYSQIAPRDCELVLFFHWWRVVPQVFPFVALSGMPAACMGHAVNVASCECGSCRCVLTQTLVEQTVANFVIVICDGS